MSIPSLYARYRDFELLTDSRQLGVAEQSLFFALPGERTDGHTFIPDLLVQGVRHFVVTEAWWTATFEQPTKVDELQRYTEATFIAVTDVLATLQELAAHHRRQFSIPVIGITGSNGKTTVKDWLAELLSAQYKVCSSPRSYNSQLGVPLSVWQLRAEHEIGVFEAGVSRAGEMEQLAHILQPTHGIFTYLGEAHAAGFQSLEQKLIEKTKLFQSCGWVLTTGDDERVNKQLAALPAETEIVSAADRAGLDHLPPIFQHNASLVVAAARLLQVTPARITAAKSSFQAREHRLKVRAAANGCTLIDDSYSNDLSSLYAALQFAASQADQQPFTLFLSDIPQSDMPPARLYQRVAQLVQGKVKRIFTVGQEIRLLQDFLPGLPVFHYPSTERLLADFGRHIFTNEVALLKGARAFRLERLLDAFTHRRHRTLLEVNLTAIAHNFGVYQQHLPAGVGIAAMVKASAYGSGSAQVARLLAEAGARYLVVAYTDEGIQLREAGISAPIMVLNPEAEAFDLLRQFDLEPVIADQPTLLLALEQYPELPLHLEFDTGMRRLGFPASAAADIAGYFLSGSSSGQTGTSQNHPAPRSVFTHLAASESAAFDDYTQEQFARFATIEAAFQQQGVPPTLRHVLNTNGISRFPERAYEMVRLGIGLYGIGDARLAEQLQPAITLKAAISGIRQLQPADRIGYGLKGQLEQPGKMGVVSIGYADGLPRLAGEGRYALLINGRPAPIIGAVCMDMCMVDLSQHPNVKVDDEVIIFGPQHPIGELARVAQTIPYEILTGIGARVHRVYVSE